MTEEQIKEQLSNRFIGILASNVGFVIDKPDLDLGIDYQLKKTTTYLLPTGKTRHTYDSRYIDLQLKATTENSILDDNHSIKYDLEAKTYNDLVERQLNGIAPLVLILFVLPHDRNLWVDIDHTEIRLRKHAYWFTPPNGALPTGNGHRIRIEIPKANMLGANCFNNLHQQFYP